MILSNRSQVQSMRWTFGHSDRSRLFHQRETTLVWWQINRIPRTPGIVYLVTVAWGTEVKHIWNGTLHYAAIPM